MFKHFALGISLITLIMFTGCGTTISSDEALTVNGDTSSNSDLDTLGSSTLDLQETLEKQSWDEMTLDLDQFDSFTYATSEKTYKIEMSFEDGLVSAYADCYKLTARYKIDESDISFSNITYGPAVELASCIQSLDADQAVYQLFLHDFEATDIASKEITLYNYDFDTEIVLSR